MWVLQEVHDLSRRAASENCLQSSSVVQNWSSIARRRLRSHKTDCQHKKTELLNWYMWICWITRNYGHRKGQSSTPHMLFWCPMPYCHSFRDSYTVNQQWIATCSTTNLAVPNLTAQGLACSWQSFQASNTAHAIPSVWRVLFRLPPPHFCCQFSSCTRYIFIYIFHIWKKAWDLGVFILFNLLSMCDYLSSSSLSTLA